MSWNGVLIGMMKIIIKVLHTKIHRVQVVHQKMVESFILFVVARGMAMLDLAVLHIVSMGGTMVRVFAVPFQQAMYLNRV